MMMMMMIPNLRRCESAIVAVLLVMFRMMTKPASGSIVSTAL